MDEHEQTSSNYKFIPTTASFVPKVVLKLQSYKVELFAISFRNPVYFSLKRFLGAYVSGQIVCYFRFHPNSGIKLTK